MRDYFDRVVEVGDYVMIHNSRPHIDEMVFCRVHTFFNSGTTVMCRECLPDGTPRLQTAHPKNFILHLVDINSGDVDTASKKIVKMKRS